MQLRHILKEGRHLMETVVGTAPTDYAQRIKAIPGWEEKDFLKSLLQQVQRGRHLSDKQIAALERMEKASGGKNGPGSGIDPNLKERIMDVLAKAARNVRGTMRVKKGGEEKVINGWITPVRSGPAGKGESYLEFEFHGDALAMTDFGKVFVNSRGDRDYSRIAEGGKFDKALKRSFIDTVERALAALVPPGSSAKE